MPFVPPNEQEKKKLGGCKSREHYPPSHMVIRDGSVWQCPACKKRTIINVPGGRL